MKRILKYTLQPGRVLPLTLPYKSVKPLCVQVQKGQPQLWLLVDEGSAEPGQEFNHDFFIFATGAKIFDPEFEEIGDYVGTFQLNGGEQVFHVFQALRWTPGS